MNMENEILNQENLYWKAMQENDIAKAVSLTRFPCTISGPQGFRQVSQEDFRKMMGATDGSKFKGITLENPKVEVLSPDSALIVYSTQIEGRKFFDTSLWVKSNDQWICGYHSEFPMSN